jgi:hypothetical protein
MSSFVSRPFVFGLVAILLDAVAIGISPIERLTHAVVGATIERNSGIHESAKCSAEGSS